ncbi:hypothetical protein FPV67DRAFT_740612 [Lyophyllum atratum]|nr:hypothetical protein FPV67DRAFT_740612 [Lyophyllum atratum]
MNDPGLDETIEEGFNNITHTLKEQVSRNSGHSSGARAAFRHELKVDEEEEEVGFDQPKRWWFTSTAFPLIAGTFGPLANLFSVCGLVQTWRVAIPDGETEIAGTSVKDPPWLLALNSISLALALIANGLLLLNFAHRIRYSIAQPFTIALWYIAAIFLIVPLGLTRDLVVQPTSTHAFGQAYYYALISAAIYTIVATLLLLNVLGAYAFKAYPPSFNSLTIPQRTLMLQSISYILYLALGAGVFSAAEGWHYTDGLYWADYTLLTIGLGTDFPLQTTLAQALLIPYAACGITMIGLVIGSVRGLVLERAKMKVIRRNLAKQRQTHIDHTDKPDEEWKEQEFKSMRRIEHKAEIMQQYSALATSFFAYLIVWFGGALVFWYSEAKPQKWRYFEAMYFAYTSLLTIGYGDFYPQSNAGKPFFVVWSLIAVPTVTVLISTMGDTIVQWLRKGTLWLGQRTVLPERDRPRKRNSSEAQTDDATAADDGDSIKRLGGDVEHLGEAIEKGEEERGRGGSLAARIAREISGVAKDVGSKPPRKYGWDEWIRWLDLLGMNSENQSKEGQTESSGLSSSRRGGSDWTWLGKDGPLFSRVSETEWVLGKLCSRLEEVLEKELDDAARRDKNSHS